MKPTDHSKNILIKTLTSSEQTTSFIDEIQKALNCTIDISKNNIVDLREKHQMQKGFRIEPYKTCFVEWWL